MSSTTFPSLEETQILRMNQSPMLKYDFIDPERQIASEDFNLVESFLKTTSRDQIGWHYITDITWIYSRVKDWPKDLEILDAGGGGGPVQFLLAELGFHVTNIDLNLSEPGPTYRQRYKTTCRRLPSFVPTSYLKYISPSRPLSKTWLKRRLKKTYLYKLLFKALKAKQYIAAYEGWRERAGVSDTPLGTVQWVVGNLCHMPEIPADSFDVVVSLSALEHIPIGQLDLALLEIRRILKPEALWAVTTSGTERPRTWFHEPSHCYCFSEMDLRARFGSIPLRPQNPSEILEKYRKCSYLKENLASFYFKSVRSGMPWGKWDPKYIPVGLER